MTRPSSHRLGLRYYWHGRLEPMSAVDAKAWERTREKHPHLYEGKANGR